MQEWIQRILVYVIIVTVLRSLIARPQYQQYFRFLSGMILILLLLSPLFRFLGNEGEWYQMLEEKVWKMDMEEIDTELAVAEGDFQTIVLEEYENTVKRQVRKMGEQQGISVKKTTVNISEEGTLQKMEIHLSEESDGVTKAKIKEFRLRICDCYQVGEEVVEIWI